MDDEGISVDDEVLVDIELRAEADAQEAARKTQSEESLVDPIFYADTATAQIPVDNYADVKFNIVYDNKNPRIKVNEYFPSMENFRMALRQHGIKKGFQVHKIKTDKTRYRAECKAEGCPWRIVARKLRDGPTVVISMMPQEHNCLSTSNPVTSMASQSWVAEMAADWLRESPELGAKELQEKLQEVYSVEVNYATVWGGRQKVMNKIFQSWEDTFQTLYNFRAELLSLSPGSVVEICTKICGDDVHFDKLFFALEQCIDGFKTGYRPDIALNYTDLAGIYLGKLACACALDGHNWMYPVAWAIFDSASNDNWTWFMEQLKKAIGNLPGLTISAEVGDNNLTESFLEWTLNIKGMPLVDLIDKLRQMTMGVWYKRRCIGSKPNGFGFVEYKDPMDARDVVPAYHGSDFMGQRLTVQFARGSRQREGGFGGNNERQPPRPRRTVHRMQITGLPGDTSWQDLKDFARQSSLDVVYSETGRDGNGRGFVEFESAADLRTAIEKLDQREFKGQRVTCVADPNPEMPTREPRGRSRSPGFRKPYGMPRDPYDRRGPPPPGAYSPPRGYREDYRDRSPRRDYYDDRRYRSPPRRGPPMEEYGAPRGRYDDPYRRDYGPPPDPYANGRPYDRPPRDFPPRDGGYGPREGGGYPPHPREDYRRGNGPPGY